MTERTRDLLVDAQQRLQRAGVASPDVDAAELLCHVLRIPRSALYLQDPVTPEHVAQFEQLLAQRVARVPLQHIIGTAPFRRMNLRVGPGVFIPRPETELVAEAAIRFLRTRPTEERVTVDLCSGSGALALAIATEVDHVACWGVELSSDAMAWSRVNYVSAEPLLAERTSTVHFVAADVATVANPGEPLAAMSGGVDLVVCNPPYIPDGMVPREPEVQLHDPAIALFGGPDGLEVIRGVIATAATLLKSGGFLVIEHADTQGESVPNLLADWDSVIDRVDLTGRPRFTMATRP